MKKLFISSILLFISVIQLLGQNDYIKLNLDKRKTEALFFIDDTRPFISNYLKIENDSIDWIYVFMELSDIQFEKLSIEFNDYLNEFSPQRKRVILQKIDIWVQLSILVNFPYELRETELTELLEILAELEQTKKFIDQFIVVDGQYWGSLSSGQGTIVYFEMMEYLFNLSDKEKLKFFADFYALAYEKGK